MYAEVLMMFLAAGFIAVAALVAGSLLGPRKATAATLAAYESGIPATGDARERFPVHFYLVAMMFIIFDIETAFFYPLAVKFQAAPQFLLANAVLFILILAVGFVYLVRKGVFDWKRAAELADVLVGKATARNSRDSIALFKSVGIALEDIALGAKLLARAKAAGAGEVLPF